ncbi:MAG TPA: hypothetical protein VH186_31675 [Chloroflexia bacterium]|nr:hypothetical protein [Chloroflexia bacterium]
MDSSLKRHSGERRKSFPLSVWILLGTSGLLALMLIVALFSVLTLQGQEAANEPVANVITNPNSYMGQAVTTNGQVGRVVSNNAFTVVQPGANGGNELLVVTKRPLDGMIPSSTKLQPGQSFLIGGSIQTLNTGSFQKQTGVTIDGNALAPWQGKAVLEADTVNPIQGQP